MGKVKYRLDFPVELSQIHNTLHVSHLWKCIPDDSTVIPLDNVQFDECLNNVETPITIIDKKTKILRQKGVNLVKVQWNHRKGSEWTWDLEEDMMDYYPDLLFEVGLQFESLWITSGAYLESIR
ncbi:uncharacterized protein LOC111890274 [Lactuca sativa]|uniref:uncharacterized protein LOC111890274 n=1 Tax=Lactuca sativa TaxID=4236 RepID=UPI000CD862A6|nr:uncharacterized protein LOC111890274 [Lactuca sativa]